MNHHCILCREILHLDEYATTIDSVTFRTWGNFGSRVFNKFNGGRLELHVCDGCLVANKQYIVHYASRGVSKPEPWEPGVQEG